MKLVERVLTVQEAGLMWGVHKSTLQRAVTGYKNRHGTKVPPRFNDREGRSIKNNTLVTYDAMVKFYGPPKYSLAEIKEREKMVSLAEYWDQ